MKAPKSLAARVSLSMALTAVLYWTVFGEFYSVLVTVGHWLAPMLMVGQMAAPLFVAFGVSQYWEGQKWERRQADRQRADDAS